MAFEIIWSEPAIRQLRKLDRTVARRIFNMRCPPGSSEKDIAGRPTDLLPRRLDRHAGNLLLDGFFDFGFQWSPRSHRDSAHLTTPRPNKLTIHQERTRPHGLGP